MSRAGNITIAILMWCAIAAYVVAATRYAHSRRASITVGSVRIAVVDTASSKLITTEKVTQWLAEGAIDPIGRSVDSVDTHAIESRLASRPEVRHASAWTDLEGTLTVRVEPRTPAMRIRTTNGYRFWFTDDGYILPDRGDLAAYVPVVTGSIPFPFSPSAAGDYAKMREENYNDFFERFVAIEAERRELASRLASVRSEIRTIRTSTPKRWWSRSRKRTFADGKAVRIAELEAKRTEITAALDKTANLESSLREKEKKSYQSYRFLSELANFVEFIGHDRFWAAQIVQIHVVGDDETRDGEWREPQLELIPRAGDHTILLGEIDGTEQQRLENLRLFYQEGLWREGWERYGHINIKYRNQIVCTK